MEKAGEAAGKARIPAKVPKAKRRGAGAGAEAGSQLSLSSNSRLPTRPTRCRAGSAATRLTPSACTRTWCDSMACQSARGLRGRKRPLRTRAKSVSCRVGGCQRASVLSRFTFHAPKRTYQSRPNRRSVSSWRRSVGNSATQLNRVPGRSGCSRVRTSACKAWRGNSVEPGVRSRTPGL